MKMKQIGKNWFERKMKSLSPNYWHNKKTKSHLYLYRDNYKFDKFNKNNEAWKVLLINGITKEQKYLEKFETKKPAIEFMEKWMKDNQE